eukprot:TRINITY_DN25829_c0_g1_i2.p1 TRINITY_DN25829_c0_g1~~TRINITY_DN25829_c0_g1_i2.p1  ORF type:complete len:467 (-),score=30.93 TRINITY_DN25829_c0_g1_i2:24-1424(-)
MESTAKGLTHRFHAPKNNNDLHDLTRDDASSNPESSGSTFTESRSNDNCNGSGSGSFRSGANGNLSHPSRDERKNEQGDTRSGVDLKYAVRPSFPAHTKLKESPLSSDAIFKQSHAGLFNLCIVVLIAVNSRLIIENIMKYGLLIQTGFWFSSKSLREWPLLMCGLTLPVFPLCSFLVEKAAIHKYISELVIFTLHVIITTAEILYPIYVIQRCHSSVLSGLALMLYATTVWLKLVSYAHANWDLRVTSEKKVYSKKEECSDDPSLACTHMVTLKSLLYFMVAPTLCYQRDYPRTKYIRKGWVLRQLLKLVIFTGVQGFIVEQYMNPIIKNSQHPLKGNFLYAIERVLKLSIPNLLNILAELVHFGDREFYKDWWNAKTIEEYWRKWNMPVHKWMVRHVYFPCLRRGMPKNVAVFFSFLISAIFHELCIGVPCHMFRYWAFLGIMFQVKLGVGKESHIAIMTHQCA